jgi:hypothetical protein
VGVALGIGLGPGALGLGFGGGLALLSCVPGARGLHSREQKELLTKLTL